MDMTNISSGWELSAFLSMIYSEDISEKSS